MKKIFTTAIVALSLNVFSQKLVKEYYDYYKTKLQAEYYTDNYGTKNGSFKGYSKYGGILLQGAYNKNGGMIGKWIENYENGKLYRIYNYVDGMLKKSITYYEDGKTIHFEKNWKGGAFNSFDLDGELDGDYKEYDQDGKLIYEDKYVNGESEKEIERKKKYNEEQAKINQQRKEQEEAQAEATAKKNAEEYKNIIPEADKAFAVKDYSKAKNLYTSASNLMDKEQYPKDKIKEIQAAIQKETEKIFEAKEQSVKQSVKIDTMYNLFKRQYAVNKQSAWLIDATTHQPIVRETYPKGEHLYRKSDAIIQPLLSEYRNITDVETKVTKGNYIITILDKMISLAGTDTKDIDKQVKKAESNDEVKKILGIQ